MCLLPQMWLSDTIPSEFKRTGYNDCICITVASATNVTVSPFRANSSALDTMIVSASPRLPSTWWPISWRCILRRLMYLVSFFLFENNASWSLWTCAFSAIKIAADTFPVWRRLCSWSVVECFSYPSTNTQHIPYFVLRKKLYCPNTSALLCSISFPSAEIQQPTAINHRHTVWRTLGCIVWHNIPHILLDFSAKFRLVYFPQEEVCEERSSNCRHLMGKVGCDILVFSLCYSGTTQEHDWRVDLHSLLNCLDTRL